MKLNNKDTDFICNTLLYSPSDIPFIKVAISNMRYIHYVGYNDFGERINQKDAIEILGRYGFLSGCARATFHNSVSMYSSDGKHEVIFEYRQYENESNE